MQAKVSELISVIVPVYKVEEYLNRAVESIVNQTYRILEIILVDDGSPDNCPVMCDAWAQKDARIRVIHKENGGVSSARNAGLKAAKGKWISFVDADDWIHPQFVEITYSQTKHSNADVIAVNCFRCNDEVPFENIDCENIVFSPVEVEAIFHNRIIRNYVWGKLYRAEIIKSKSFDEKLVFGEDSAFNAEVFTDGNLSVYYSELKLYYYYQRQNSAVHTFKPEQLVLLSNKYIELAENEKHALPKSIYLMEAMKRALSARYGLLYVPDTKETIIELTHMLKKSANELKHIEGVSFKNKCMYLCFSYCPQLYRVYRIIGDPTLLKWEKEKREKRNNTSN